MTQPSGLAAIQMQIMWNRLISVVEEQVQTLIRTAFSTSVREAGDLSAGVYDLRGNMLAQAVTAGGAAYGIMDLFMDVPEQTAVKWVLLGGVGATAALIAMEITSQGSRHVELAVHEMTKGKYGRQFWWGGIGMGIVIPAALMIVSLSADTVSPGILAVAGLSALIGLFAYEDAFVRAGQSVPLS